jgi:hypothetical protein
MYDFTFLQPWLMAFNGPEFGTYGIQRAQEGASGIKKGKKNFRYLILLYWVYRCIDSTLHFYLPCVYCTGGDYHCTTTLIEG